MSAMLHGDARDYATAGAALLRLDFEDATTDHPVRRAAGQAEMSPQQRLQMDGLQNEPARPPDARSEVTREADGVRIATRTRAQLEIRERGAWRTAPVNSLPAAEILDIDFSTSESVTTAARLAAEQRRAHRPDPGRRPPKSARARSGC